MSSAPVAYEYNAQQQNLQRLDQGSPEQPQQPYQQPPPQPYQQPPPQQPYQQPPPQQPYQQPPPQPYQQPPSQQPYQQPPSQQPYQQPPQQPYQQPPQQPYQQQLQQPHQQPPQPPPQAPDSNIPPGLYYLANLDQILIKQQKEMLEVLTGWETANKYVVLNNLGQQIFFAKEDSNTFQRQCCGAQRAFEMVVKDNTGQEVILIHRPYKCMCYGQCFSCAKCCQDTVSVEAPPGRLVGKVTQVYDGCAANYKIEDSQGNTVVLIRGPSYFACHCPGDDIPFVLQTKDGNSEIGRVSKQWSNLLQEYFTDADNFGITFPKDLHLDVKATIIGACFLIDFMYFERSGRQHQY